MQIDKQPSPREAMIIRSYDSGAYESPAKMGEVTRSEDYANILDAWRPGWRLEAWKNPVRWHVNRVERQRGSKSADWVSGVLRRFDAFRNGKPITPAMVDAWMSSLTAKASSRNRWARCVKTYLRDIDAMGWLPEPLDRYLVILKEAKEDTAPVRVLTPAELRHLLRTAAGMKQANGLRVYLLASLVLGTRPGETLKLRGNSILTSRFLVRVPKFKGGAERLASYKWSAIGPELFELLRERRGNADALCRGAMTTSGWNRLIKAAGMEGLDRRVLRATSRSAYSESAAIPESYLRRMFGHTTEVADNRYIDGGSQWCQGDTIDEWLGCAAEMRLVFNAFCKSERIKRDQVLRVPASESSRQATGDEAEAEGRIVIDCGTAQAGSASLLYHHDDSP